VIREGGEHHPEPGAPHLVVRGLVRRFPGVVALGGVDLTAARGEVLAVVGENGAGKSTLLRCLAGLDRPDAGHMELGGQRWAPASAAEASRGGLALVHQELCLAENLSAAENITLGREPRGRLGWVDRRAAHERGAHALARVGARFRPDVRVERLSAGERQLVEIAKGLDQDAQVLILDEPTSSLSTRETATLSELVRELSAAGITVLYVSHRLGEVLDLADRAIVLRDGRNSGSLSRAELSRERLVELMVGRALEASATRATHVDPRPLGSKPVAARLCLRGLVTEAFPNAAIDLDVHAGELVGLAGLNGAGRTELLETIFGLRRALGGEVLLDGVAVHFRGPREAQRAGVGLVPEDRKGQGLLLGQSLRVNLALATLSQRARGPWIDRAAERTVVAELSAALGVVAAGPEQLVETLSGGNQQKVVIGRWLAAAPRLLLLDEPTRGVDVGAREELYAVLEALTVGDHAATSAAGRDVGACDPPQVAAAAPAVLFASSDLEELMRLADRIVVLRDGHVAGTLLRAAATEERIIALATDGGALGT